VGGSAQQVSAGGTHTCALLSGGELKCWGFNANGQLAYGDTTPRYAPPSQTISVDGSASLVSAGWTYTCPVLAGGQAKCWGDDSWSQLGYGDGVGRRAPSADPINLAGVVRRAPSADPINLAGSPDNVPPPPI